MAVTVPSFIPIPWAENGQTTTIPQTTAEQGRASWDQGFPQVCALPLSAGGIPPNYLDFQGIFNALSSSIFYMQTGALWPWSSTLTYPLGAHVLGSDNNEYVAVQENSGQDPMQDATGTYWKNSSAQVTGPDFIGMIAPFASTNLPEGWMICDGSSALFADWPEFQQVYNEGRFTGMTLSASDPAQKGKFVLNGSTGVYLPDLEGLFVQASAAGTAGAYVAPGLPNIKGAFPTATEASTFQYVTGAFSIGDSIAGAQGGGSDRQILFDASTYNATYADTVTTVQPPTVQYVMAMYLGKPAAAA